MQKVKIYQPNQDRSKVCQRVEQALTTATPYNGGLRAESAAESGRASSRGQVEKLKALIFIRKRG